MWGKISTFFAIGLLHLEAACTNSRSSPPPLSIQQKIQNDILDNTHAHDDFLLKFTPPGQNVQFIPLCAEVSVNIFKLNFYYYESDLALYFTKDEYLSQTYFLSNLTDTLQKSSNVELKVNNAIFYDQENTSQPFLDDVKKYYHAELYNVSFDPADNETLLVSINQWIAKNTKDRAQKLHHLTTKGKSYLQVSLLSYTACWDKPKTPTYSIKTLNFKTPQEKIKTAAFNSKEKIGYYNNSKLKYEAIRIPYKNNEFAMIIMLPYPDQSLKSLSNFSTAQYLHLFGNVSTHQENIDYTIPSINLPMISLNENGTAVNGEDLVVCDSFPAQKSAINDKKPDYKTFYVDRPFGIYIYNEKTKIVLVHSWIRNPTSSLSTLGSSPGKSSDVLLIQSSNLYEITHMLA